MKKNLFKKINIQKRGFTMVETIFYLTFLLVLVGIVVSLIVSLSKTYQTVQATKNLESSAVFSLERLTRDIRNSVSASVEGNILTLNTIDFSGYPQINKYYISENTHVLSLDSDGVYVGPLTLNGVEVKKIDFKISTSSNSEAIKIDLDLSSTVGTANVEKSFHDSVVLRESH